MKSCRSGGDGDEDEDENDDKRLCVFSCLGEAMRVLKARIVKEVEANQKRIKKELEKQDVLRRKMERAEITVKCPKCGNLGHICASLGEQCLPMKQEMSQSTVCFESLKKEFAETRLDWGCLELSTRAVVFVFPTANYAVELQHYSLFSLLVPQCQLFFKWLTPSLMDVRIFVKVLAWRWRWLWLAATKADTRFFKNLCSKRKEWAVIRIGRPLTLDNDEDDVESPIPFIATRRGQQVGIDVIRHEILGCGDRSTQSQYSQYKGKETAVDDPNANVPLAIYKSAKVFDSERIRLGNIIEVALWDDMARWFNKDAIMSLRLPVIAVVNSMKLPKTTITKKKLAESQVHVESKEIAGHYILHVHEYPEKLTLTYKPEEDIESAESE
ncbi:hypothetical protein Tco_0765507 [Tanacetum coccineum]